MNLFLPQYQQENLLQLALTFAKAYASGVRLINSYGSVYLMAFEEAVNSDRPLYDAGLRLVDKGLQKELKSGHFLSLLSGYTDSLVELHSAFRRAGYPVDYLDWMADCYRQTFRIPLSMQKELNLAPHDLVYTKGKVRLLHYSSAAGKGRDLQRPPLLIVYAPINQFHVLDLNARRSVVRNLLSSGLDIYLLDWGFPGLEDRDLGLGDYINYVHDAVQAIRQQTGSEKVSLLGYCWGGMFSLIYTALNNDSVKSLALMATPVDFSKDDTMLGIWSRAIDVGSMMGEFGQMDGQVLDMAFLMRNPPRYGFDKYLRLLKRSHDAEFVCTFADTERWLYDTPPIPGNLYRQIINDCYKNNLLVSNSMQLDGRKINLQNVTVPLLTIVAERDDIVSSGSALAVNDHVSSKDKATLQNPGGHVALCIGDKAHEKLWPEVARWILSK